MFGIPRFAAELAGVLVGCDVSDGGGDVVDAGLGPHAVAVTKLVASKIIARRVLMMQDPLVAGTRLLCEVSGRPNTNRS